MRRFTAATVLLLAGLIGGGVGVLLHTVWPDPFSQHAATPSTLAPSTSGAATPSPSSVSPPASPSSHPPSSSPRPARPTPSPAPAFTRLALLTPENFLDRGWATARVVDRFDQLPSAAITPCTTIRADQDGITAGYAATYTSDRTSAAEVVVRFADVDRAVGAFDTIRAAISGCADASAASDRVRVTDSHQPSADGVSELRWWNTRPLESGTARGVIGLVRVDDRVALISLRSDVSDPAETTKITSLVTIAGRRLV